MRFENSLCNEYWWVKINKNQDPECNKWQWEQSVDKDFIALKQEICLSQMFCYAVIGIRVLLQNSHKIQARR